MRGSGLVVYGSRGLSGERRPDRPLPVRVTVSVLFLNFPFHALAPAFGFGAAVARQSSETFFDRAVELVHLSFAFVLLTEAMRVTSV